MDHARHQAVLARGKRTAATLENGVGPLQGTADDRPSGMIESDLVADKTSDCAEAAALVGDGGPGRA